LYNRALSDLAMMLWINIILIIHNRLKIVSKFDPMQLSIIIRQVNASTGSINTIYLSILILNN